MQITHSRFRFLTIYRHLGRIVGGMSKRAASDSAVVRVGSVDALGVGDVVHEKEHHRFSLYDPSLGEDSEPVAFVEYRVGGGVHVGSGEGGEGVLELYHTFSNPAYRGKGLASKVVEAAFQHASHTSLRILPTCSYVHSAFLPKHPAYHAISLTTPGHSPFAETTTATKVESPKKGGEGEGEGEGEEEDDEEEDEEERRKRMLEHGFVVAYEQRAAAVYEDKGEPGRSGGLVQVGADLANVARLGAMLVERGLEETDVGRKKRLLEEAGRLIGVCIQRDPDGKWNRAYGVSDAIEHLQTNHIPIPAPHEPVEAGEDIEVGAKRERA